jgi:hypothetical protein
MVIYVNEQVRTKYRSSPGPDIPTIYKNRTESGTPTLGSGVSSVARTADRLLSEIGNNVRNAAREIFTNSTQNGSIGGRIESLGQSISQSIRDTFNDPNLNLSDISNENFGIEFTRKLRRTSRAIALYMPDTLNFTQNQSYQDLSFSGNTLVTGLFAGVSMADMVKKYGAGIPRTEFVNNLGPFLANYFLGNAGTSALFGTVSNPLLDVIYSSPQLRTFRFDFAFYPRSGQEALEVQNIINTLKFHQAPEIAPEGNGYFMVPPSEFDIKFFYNGRENPNIPKISTCVLESIDVDYAPNGFAAYEVPGENSPSRGGTGTPVAVRVSLQFKETLYLTKEYYASPSVGEGDNLSQSNVPTFSQSQPTVTVNRETQGGASGAIIGGEVTGVTTTWDGR